MRQLSPEGCEDVLINDLDHALHLAKSNEEWGNDYMTLELLKQEERRKGEIKGEKYSSFDPFF